MVFVLPAPAPVGIDPDVEQVVRRVESAGACTPRILEVDVPPEELALATPLDVDRVRSAALEDQQPASVPLRFLVDPLTLLELSNRHPLPAWPPDSSPRS